MIRLRLPRVELEVDRRPDNMTGPASGQAHLAIGPFGFGVATQDGGWFGVSLQVRSWRFSWSLESTRFDP